MHKRFFKSLFNHIAKINLNYPFLCLFSAIIATIFSFAVIVNLKLDSSLTNLLPDDYESVQDAKKILHETGGTDNFIILVEGAPLDKLIAAAEKIHAVIRPLPNIKHVYYKRNKEFFYKKALLYSDLKDLKTIYKNLRRQISKKKLAASPFYFSLKKNSTPKKQNLYKELDDFLSQVTVTAEKKYYYSSEKDILAITIIPFGEANNITFTRKIYSSLQQRIQQAHIEKINPNIIVSIGGSYKNKIDEYETIIHDIFSTAAIVALLIFIIISMYFRNFFAVLLITVPLFMSISWTFAIAQLTIGKLNTFTGFLFIILFGLGVDFGIHLFARYVESRKKLLTIASSIKTMFRSSGKASMTSGFTTAVVFFSLTLTSFKGFSEFGFIAGIGIVMAMIGYFIVLPALLIFFEKFNFIRFEKLDPYSFRLSCLNKIPVTKTFSKRFFYALSIFSLLSCYGLFALNFNYNFKDLRANLPKSLVVKEKISYIFPDSFSPAVFISNTLAEVDSLNKYFKEKIATDSETPTISKIMTIRDVVPRNQEEKFVLFAKIKKLLFNKIIPPLKKSRSKEDKDRLNKIYRFMKYLSISSPIHLSDVPIFYKNKFLNRDSTKYISYVLPSVQLRNGKNAIAFAKDVRNISINNTTYRGGGSFIVFADMLQSMIQNGKLATILSLISVFLVLLIDFRKISRIFIVSFPLIVGLVWCSFIMFITGASLNFFNIIVIPSIIGLGIDNGVHLYHRFLEEKGKNLRSIFINTGGAIFMTSLTTIIGFSGLAFAQHGGLNSIGRFAVIGTSICFIATIAIMPNLFNLIRREHSK